MSDQMPPSLHPEDYWPEAGKMLDVHFARKRRRRVAAWLLLLLFISGGSLFLLQKDAADKSQEAETTLSPDAVTSGSASATLQANQDTKETSSANTESADRTKAPVINQPAPATSSAQKGKPVNRNSQATVEDKFFPDSHPLTAVSGTVQLSGEETLAEPDLHSSPAVTEPSFLPDPAFRASLLQAVEVKNTLHLPDSFPSRSTKRLKQQGRLELVAYAGLQHAGKEITGEAPFSVIRRREQEEEAVWMPYAGLQISAGRNNWDFRAGVELSVMGERLNYSPYANGIYYNVYQDWQPYTYSVTDTDSTFIFGILFLNTSTQTVNDSQLVSITDTLNGIHYDPAIAAVNGINRWYTLEVPLEAAYTVRKGRWGVGLSAGIAPGLLIREDTRYLRDDEDGIYRPETDIKQQWTLNLRAGAEFSYLMNARMRFLLRPSARYFFTPLPSGERMEQRYRALGFNAGVVYSFR